MKRKTITGLIAIAVIVAVVIFAGCVETEEVPSTPTSTPLAPTTTPEATSTELPVTKDLGEKFFDFKEKPDPYFSSKSYGEGHTYAPGGVSTGASSTMEVRNRGGPGEVFVKVQRGDLNTSKVFYMDKDESVMVHAHFRGITGPGPRIIKWTARAALPDDTSQGEMGIERSNIKRIGRLDIGKVKDVAVLGDYAYVVIEEPWPYDSDTAFMADISLKVIDVSNPSNPKEVGRYDFSHANTAFSKYGVCVIDQYAYVAIGLHEVHDDNGLHIIDVSDPSVPRRVGQYRIEGGTFGSGTYDVAVAENYAYVITDEEPQISSRGESLLVFDISAPSNPRNVGQCEISSCWHSPESITVKDSYAYIVSYGRLHVIDISITNSPREVVTQRYKGGVTCTGKHSIAVSDSYAYITTLEPSLFVFDIGSPSNPIEIGKYSPEKDYISAGYEVSVSGTYAYIAYRKGLLVIDISNPSTPVQVGQYTGMEVSGNCVAVSGNYVYLGGESGLHIFESYR